MIVKLPPILPGDLNLADLNQKLRSRTIELDWSAVISAPESQLAILLEGVDSVDDIDWLVTGDIADNIATDILNYFNKPKSSKKTEKPKKIVNYNTTTNQTPQVHFKRSSLYQVQPTSIQDKPLEEKSSPVDVNKDDLPESEGENSDNRILQPPSPYEIRAELEKAVLADLLGPVGGEDEEVEEGSISDRYLVGLIAPQQRRKTAESVNTSSNKQQNQEVDLFREVDCQQPEYLDELAVAGKGTVEDGTTEVSVPPAETMFPSSFGMTFCVSGKAKALQVSAGWGQYKREKSQKTTKPDDTPKTVWKRQQIRGISPAIPLADGEIKNWIVHPNYPLVYVKGKMKKQTNGDWIVSLFLINGQKEPERKRDEAWLFQPELSVISADPHYTNIFIQRQQPRIAGKLDPAIYAEEKSMAMLYRKQVEFAIGHGVSVHANRGVGSGEWGVGETAVKLETTFVPRYEVAKTSPPNAGEISELAGLVLDMKELGSTPTAEFATKLNPLVIAYQTWIQQQALRITDPNEKLADFQDVAQKAIANCTTTLQRIQSGLTLLLTNEKAAEAFRFMNQAMYLQRIRSIYSEQVRQGQIPEIDKIKNPTWFPFQLAFILLNLPSITDLDHPDRSHETSAIADLLWFPTGGGKTEAYLGLTAYTIGLRRLQGVISGRSGEFGVAVLMRYTLRLLTLQQFQRATTLICACEAIRRD